MWWKWAREIHLTPEDEVLYTTAGKTREKVDRSLGLQTAQALIKGKTTEEGNILGVAGEYAFDKMYNLPWDPDQSIGKTEHPDATIMGYTWDVKTTEDTRYMSLNVKCSVVEAHPWDYYALVYKNGNRFQHIGCASLREVRRARVVRNTGTPFYAVSYKDLRIIRADWLSWWRQVYDAFGPAGGWVLKDEETGVVIAKATDVL